MKSLVQYDNSYCFKGKGKKNADTDFDRKCQTEVSGLFQCLGDAGPSLVVWIKCNALPKI